jgi:hypothetical protein
MLSVAKVSMTPSPAPVAAGAVEHERHEHADERRDHQIEQHGAVITRPSDVERYTTLAKSPMTVPHSSPLSTLTMTPCAAGCHPLVGVICRARAADDERDGLIARALTLATMGMSAASATSC